MFRVYESRENIPSSDVADSLITGSRLDQEVIIVLLSCY